MIISKTHLLSCLCA